MSAPVDALLRASMVRFTTLEPSLWPRAATALGALGFNAVDLPLVWREHESPDGTLDFTTGRRAVGAALDAVAAAGLSAVVRVGPVATPDAVGLGLPERVLWDRACQARTRRQNPVVVPDAARWVPWPSLVSQAYRRASAAWVRAACEAVAPWVARGVVVRVTVGHGPHPALRDDPFELDHHPDGGTVGTEPPTDPDAARAVVRRGTQQACAYLHALVAAAHEGGMPAEVITVAVQGGVMASPVALAMADTHRVVLAAPLATAGTVAAWRQVGYGSELPHGVHWDVRAGSPVTGAPVRAVHAVQAARVALAAGARDITVLMGCSGDRWAGALLDERAVARASGPLWAGLLAWAQTLPAGETRCARVRTTEEEVTAQRAATAVRPLPLGLLSWLVTTPGALAEPTAPWADGETLGDRETARTTVEHALTAAGIPWRWTPAGAVDEFTYDGGDAAGFVTRARDPMGAFTVDPPGGALVRTVVTDTGVAAVVLSAAEEPVTVHPPPGWSGDGTVIPPGEAVVLEHTGAVQP